MSSSAEVPSQERPDEPTSREGRKPRRKRRAKKRRPKKSAAGKRAERASRKSKDKGKSKDKSKPEPSSKTVELMRLEPDKILYTCGRLQRRIDERFPDSGLSNVCAQLNELARRAEATAADIQEPERRWLLLRWSVIGLILIGLVGAFVAVIESSPEAAPLTVVDFVQVGEATVNDVILLGGAIWFFWSLDTRRKRTKVVHAVNELRTVAHLVDVHQLTKSPETLGHRDHDTASSPKRELTAYEMSRYLDYCSEMLSLVGKIGALYSEAFDDSEALEAVSELESFSTGVQGRIWQKIILLQSRLDRGAPPLL